MSLSEVLRQSGICQLTVMGGVENAAIGTRIRLEIRDQPTTNTDMPPPPPPPSIDLMNVEEEGEEGGGTFDSPFFHNDENGDVMMDTGHQQQQHVQSRRYFRSL